MIRKADLKDVNNYSELILLASPEFKKLFPNPEELMKELFKIKHNLFSYEHVKIIEKYGKTAGMILSFNYESKKKEGVITGVLIILYSGIKILNHIRQLIRAFKETCRITKGDYYVSNIAVYKEYQGCGLGTKLLKYIEKGQKTIILDVNIKNERAINFYKKHKYTEIKKNKNYIQMKKTINLE